MAKELEELFSNDEFDSVPYWGLTEAIPEEGYYTLSNIDVNPPEPRVSEAQKFDGAMTKKGTRRTFWRAVTTNTRTSLENDFGSGSENRIAIPGSATNVRWYNNTDGSIEEAGAGGNFDTPGSVQSYEYIVSNPSFDDPTLIYDVPYEDEELDMIVWDTNGNSNKTDGDGNVQWDRVYDVNHEFTGNVIISSTVYRLQFAEGANPLTDNDLTAEEYGVSWSSVSLGASDWEFYDLNINKIAPFEVEAQVEFVDTTTNPNSFYSLDLIFYRDNNWPLWIRPQNENSATPSGLQTLLDPIASPSTVESQPTKTLIERTEVEK
jgi:hypothetical protein